MDTIIWSFIADSAIIVFCLSWEAIDKLDRFLKKRKKSKKL
jgi:hypothetical protein